MGQVLHWSLLHVWEPVSEKKKKKPPNLCQLTVDKSLHPHNPAAPTGSRPYNRLRCLTCPSHHPTSPFTSSCTALTYPITTHADNKSMNLIYQLQCTNCKAFYIGETHRSLSDHMNGHLFTHSIVPRSTSCHSHTIFHQVPFQDCWSVSVIYKLPDSTPSAFTANLKLHTSSSSNHIIPPD